MKYLRLLLLLLPVMALSAFALRPQGYAVGDEVSDFSLKNVDGEMVSLADYPKAQGFIVVFTCNHCPYAKAYEDRILFLDKTYSPKYPVIAINPNDPTEYPEDSFPEMVKRAKKKKYSFPYLIDETQEVAKAFGATKTPEVYFLVKADDKLIVKYIGAIDDNYTNADKAEKKYVQNAIAAVTNGTNPDPAETKAIGCTIKWKK